MRTRALVPTALVSVLAIGAPPYLRAQTGGVEQAKTYFSAGAEAYAAGKFPAAIQAFEEAHRLAARPAILFSIAQAHRRQFYVDGNAEHLRQAIARYRQYLQAVEQGGRRADAAQALAEIEPVAAKLAASGAPGPAATAQAKNPTRLMVSCTQTKDALVALDGRKPVETPLIEEVAVGKHTVRVTADGWYDEQREVVAVEGGLVALDVVLREKPAVLAVSSLDGAQIALDGRPAGALPMRGPLQVAPGRHLVAVTKNGRRAWAREVDLGRGETRTLVAGLETTGQRKASWALFAASGASAVAGGVFVGLALRQQRKANKVLDEQKAGNVTPSRLDAYDAARSSRDDWRRAATWAFGGAVALGATGLVLYAFDQPSVEAAPAGPEPRPDRPAPRRPAEGVEVSAAPWIGPDGAGIAARGRF